MKFLTPIALLVASIGLYVTFISPQFQAVKDVRAQIAEYDSAIDRTTQLDAKRTELLNQRDSLNQDDLNRLMKFLPVTVDPIQLIIDTNGVANRYNTSISSINVTADTSKATPPTTTASAVTTPVPTATLISFSVKLPYDQFQKFIQDFERSLRLTDIATISFTPTDDGSAYTYNVSLRTYSLK